MVVDFSEFGGYGVVMVKARVLALLSGGLDSTLAVNIVHELGLDVEAVHFTTPFCVCDKCAVDQVADRLDIQVHHIYMGQDYLDLVVDPPHGYGSRMNICIDCRIHMFREARKLAKRVGAEYFVTGEVVDQRPFSQRMGIMQLIEREAGVEGRVLRPLSAGLLPETGLEERGVIDRGMLHSIQGRRRLPQMDLAEEYGINDYPCPSGGCLLTDPHYSKRLRDYLEHEGRPTVEQMTLLRYGRHFRVNGVKLIVGRDEGENRVLGSMAKYMKVPTMSVVDYVGPITLIMENGLEGLVRTAASITVRYSDAPDDTPVEVRYLEGEERNMLVEAVSDDKLENWRV